MMKATKTRNGITLFSGGYEGTGHNAITLIEKVFKNVKRLYMAKPFKPVLLMRLPVT